MANAATINCYKENAGVVQAAQMYDDSKSSSNDNQDNQDDMSDGDDISF